MKKRAKKKSNLKVVRVAIGNKKNSNKITKRKKLSSGIKNYDKLIGGGFKEKTVNILSGGPGTGKTIFTIHFLVEGMKKGEKVIYITPEEEKEKLYEDILSLGIDLAKYEKQGKFFFLKYGPEQVKSILVEGGGEIENIIEKNKIKRLVIDSFTSFTLLYKSKLERKEAALELIKLLNNWGCTSILTLQEAIPKSGELPDVFEIEFDSITLLYHTKIKGKRIRGIEILKMSGAKTPDSTFSYEITKKGIKISARKIRI